MNSTSKILALICSHVFAQSALACEQPGDVSIPDGRVASEKEMIQANASVKSYVAMMLDYQACLESEAQALRAAHRPSDKESAQRQEDDFSRRYSAASEAIVQTAERFQRTVEEYTARN